MSYLVLPDGIPDFDKAVISFWFKIPKETMEAVAKQNDDPPNPRPRMNGIIPLCTFGPALDGYQMKFDQLPMTSYGDGDGIMWNGSEAAGGIWSDIVLDPPVEYTPGMEITAGDKTEEDPSHIGVYCQSTEDDEGGSGVKGYLHIKLQLSDVGSGVGQMGEKTVHISDQWYCGIAIFEDEHPAPKASFYQPGSGPETGCIEKCYPEGGDAIYEYTNVDYTELFTKSFGGDCFMAGSEIEVKPDTWHHVLISFDISSKATSTGTVYEDIQAGCAGGTISESGEHTLKSDCKMWIAFDDKNYDKWHLRWNYVAPPGDPNRDDQFGLGPNGIAPDMNYFGYYGQALGHSVDRWEGQQHTIVNNPAGPAPTYTSTGSKIKSQGEPFGIPCAPTHVGHDQHHVEMAEFLFFTDVLLDTTIEENRRMFITGKDKDGKQHPTNPQPATVPVLKEAIGDPATWEPGADWPVYVPPSLDATSIPSSRPVADGKPKTAAVDFTKSSFTWMIGRNLGTATQGKQNMPQRTGKIKERPGPVLEPVAEE